MTPIQGRSPSPCPLWRKDQLPLGPPLLRRKLLHFPSQTWENGMTLLKNLRLHSSTLTSKMNPSLGLPTPLSHRNYIPLGDYISQFKNQVAISEITHKDTLINFFSRGIPPALMKRIYGMDTVPTKIEDWYIRATQFKTQWERADMVAKRRNYTPFTQPKTNTPSQSTPKQDPYAMDIDAVKVEKLTQEEREKCFREGRCLRCRNPGHFQRNCTQFTEWPQPKKPQEKPRKVAVVEEEQEFEDQIKEFEEATVGKVSVGDF